MGTLTVKGGTLTLIGGGGVSSPIERLNARLAQRTTGPVRVAFAGSSTTQGNNATTAANRYVNRLVTAMQTAYPSGTGSESTVVLSLSADWGTLTTAAGVHGYNAGHGGTNSNTYLTADEITKVVALDPAAVLHMIGSNDFQSGMAIATYKANVQSKVDAIKAAVPGCVQLLVQSYQRLDVASPAIPWAQYGQALAEIAAADPANLVFVDLSGLYVPIGVPGADPANIIDTDNIHQTDAGHQLMAEALRVALRIPATPAPVTPPADATAPTVPGTPVATAGQGSATATTSGSTDAVGVTAYRWRRNGTTLVSGQTGTSMTDTGLPAGTAVFYTVSALDAAGNESAQSAASNSVTPTAPSDTTAPTVPGTPTATAGVNSASVAFAASTDAVGVAGYRVYSSSDGYTAVAATGTTSPITVGSLAGGAPVTFKVAAYDAAGNVSAQSAASNSVTPTAPVAGLPASDNFNRSNASTLGTATSGHVWTATGGTYSITGNAATGTGGIATIPVGTTEMDISVAVVYAGGATNAGITFCATDVNNRLAFYLDVNASYHLSKLDAGALVDFFSAASGKSVASGQTRILRVTRKAGVLTAYIDGTQVATYTLSGAEQTKYTATNAGLRMSAAAAITFDDFQVLAPA